MVMIRTVNYKSTCILQVLLSIYHIYQMIFILLAEKMQDFKKLYCDNKYVVMYAYSIYNINTE